MNARLFQPYFLASLAASLVVWVVAAVILRGAGLEVVIVAGFVFALVAATTLLIFTIWRFGSKSENVLFFGSYVSWFLLSLLWAAVAYGLTLVFAVVVAKCCENSWFLNVTLWNALHQSTEELLLTVWYGLLLYISVWLVLQLKASKRLVVLSKIVAVVSALLFGTMLLVVSR